MSRWFRFYDGVVDDPKVQRLPAPLFKFWVNALCLASANGGDLPALVDMAFKMRMTEKQVSDSLQKLVNVGLVDELDGMSTPHNWNGRQFKSDDSKERVKRHRDRHKQQDVTAHVTDDVTVIVTPPETEQRQSRTETEQKQDTSVAASRPPAVLGPEFIRLPTNRFESQGEEVPIYEPFVAEMQRSYAAVDVPEQLRAMRAWLIANKDLRKTRKGMTRFINGWLSRKQDKGNPRETSNRGRGPSAHDKHNAGAALFIASLGGDHEQRGQGQADSDADGAFLPLLAS